jgi:hypothetical protein
LPELDFGDALLAESVLLGLDGCGAAWVPSAPLAGAVIGSIVDASGVLTAGAAGALSPVVLAALPAEGSGWIAGACAVGGEVESPAVVVWACAAAVAKSAPAAKNGISLLLSVMDASPL